MTITSSGYDGTVTEVQWAKLAASLGTPYGVVGHNDWLVETVAGQDRTVRVLAGSGYGHGVFDTSDAAVTLQLPVIASGSRWDTVFCRRDWATNTTSFVTRTGAAAQLIASGRLLTPGVSDEQPLALVKVTAGQTLPTQIVDLRTWASKVITANSLQAVPVPTLGTEVVIGEDRYRWGFDPGDGPVTPSSTPGWTSEHALHSLITDAPANVGSASTTYIPVTDNRSHECTTGRVLLAAHAIGNTDTVGLSGEVRVQINGTTIIGPPIFHPHDRVSGAGQIAYAGTFLHDFPAPATHFFRLVARRRAGSGLFTVLAGASLSVVDVRR